MARWDYAIIAAAILGGLYLLRESGKDLYNAVSQLSPSTQVKEVYNTVSEKIYDTKSMVTEKVSSTVSSVERDFASQVNNLLSGDVKAATEWGIEKGKSVIIPGAIPVVQPAIDFWTGVISDAKSLNTGKDTSSLDYNSPSKVSGTVIYGITDPSLSGSQKDFNSFLKSGSTSQTVYPWLDPALDPNQQWASKYSVLPEFDSRGTVSKVGVLKPEYTAWQASQPVIKGSGSVGYYSK